MRAERLIVWGAGGHGRVVADIARAAGHEVVGFVDQIAPRAGKVADPVGARVIVSQADFESRLERHEALPGDASAIALAIGDNVRRLELLRRLDAALLPALVHPTAVGSPSAVVGRGSVVGPMAVLNAAAVVGDGVIVNSAAVIEHDCRLADGCHVSPGAVLAGGVSIGERSWIGAGAVVIEGITIGAGVVVGAGAVVIRDVPDGQKVVGCPARPI